ncbi:MAG: polyprenyl synthetase family protein [Planctomycetota bacterium]
MMNAPLSTPPLLRTPSQARPEHPEHPEGQAAIRSRVADLYAPIAAPMRSVEAMLRQQLQSEHLEIDEVLRHGTQLGGKRLRPALTLLAGAAVGQIAEAHIIVGTVVEMVHTATLIHDDVLDHAENRRHVPTVNARWNNDVSILLGDYLFAQAYRLAATLPTTIAAREIGEAARRVCEGELHQILRRGHSRVSQETYIDMIRGKTAELLAVACRLGAQYAGGDEATVEALGEYGQCLGVTFQIADDYLDLWGNDAEVGKTLGTDVEQGKWTLPLIRHRAVCDPDDRLQLDRAMQLPPAERLRIVRGLLERSDCRSFTKRVAQEYCERAVRVAESLPDSEASRTLVAIARFSLRRHF